MTIQAIDTLSLDLLLTELLGVSLGLADLVLCEANLLYWNGFLLDIDAFLVQCDRCFIVAKIGVHVACFVTGDWLALNANFLASNWYLNGLGVGDDVLAQAYLAGFNALLVDVQALLGAYNCVVSGAVTIQVAVTIEVTITIQVAVCGQASACTCAHAGLAVAIVMQAIAAIMTVTLGVLGVRELVVLVDALLIRWGQDIVLAKIWSILDAVLRERKVQVAALKAVASHWHQAGAHAEETVSDLNKGWLAGVVINVDFLNVAKLVAIAVVSGGVEKVLDVLLGSYLWNFLSWTASHNRLAARRAVYL